MAVARPPTMNGPLNKRQQARNEKVLQELVHSVPGNNQCADCQARNPGSSRVRVFSTVCLILACMLTSSDTGWASWSVCPYPSPSPLFCFRVLPAILLLAEIPPRRHHTGADKQAVGHLSLHEMRVDPSEAGHPYLKGEVVEHGRLVE